MSKIKFGPNRLIIFDLDGVLIDSRDLHFSALNSALGEIESKFVISREDHEKSFDGLNTQTKLNLITEYRGLDRNLHQVIWKRKQEITRDLLENVELDHVLIDLFKLITENQIHIAVASNSIRRTVELILEKLGILKFVDFYIGNEDVDLAKPFPEAYWRCMMKFQALPSHTVIFEDSEVGRRGALESGGNLMPVRNRSDINLQKIAAAIEYINGEEKPQSNPQWNSEELNVLIPMAGAGSRFKDAGFTFPKPLIEVLGKPMIQAVVNNLNVSANYIYIVQEKDYEKYNLFYLLNLITPGCQIVKVDGITEGAACTTLLAKDLIDSNKSLLIANSDQIIDWDSFEVMFQFETNDLDGGILTFNSVHPKWSYVRLDSDDLVVEVAEKKPISNLATVGIYYWRRGSDYVKYAEQMIREGLKVNGEYYVCPVYNFAIEDGKKIRTKNVERMWGIGTPEDLDIYLRESEK